MRTLISLFFFSLIALTAAVPAAALAQTGNESITNIWRGTGNGTITCNQRGMQCTLCDGIRVAKNVTEFLTVIAVALAVLIIMYGALRMMTSGGNENWLSAGKEAILKALLGLAIVAASWLIVDTVFKALTENETWNSFDPIGCKNGAFIQNPPKGNQNP
jgi:hypothetical protein